MSNTRPECRESDENKCINTIRALCMDAIEKAGSGHPGAPMGMAPAAYVLWTKVMKHNPANPKWADRDRFILSGGHASMLLYSLLYFTGYDLSLDDIKNFRQWNSKTPGHPEYGHTPGVEMTTGPLGQGIASGVGMAMAEAHLAARFNKDDCKIVDHYTYVMCGDGDLMEGISYEATSLAGHLGLGKLICLYDDNEISIEGTTDITFTEDVKARFKAIGWHVLEVYDGNDTKAVYNAIIDAKKEDQKPSLIIVKTKIAYGSPNKQGSASAHGSPLGEEEVKLAKKNLGCPEDECFYVEDDALGLCRSVLSQGKEQEKSWNEKLKEYSEKYPDMACLWQEAIGNILPPDWNKNLPYFTKEDAPIATRAASGIVLNALSEKIPALMGGSADLAPSNKTIINASHDFQKDNRTGRNIRFGVREHGMGAIVSGMALHGGIRPFAGTFFVFADYMRPSIRLASLMGLPVTYVFTHDSIAVGEDGPTHQPVEHLASLRAIPGLVVIRPADANETREAWKMAMTITDMPVALVLSRQKLPVLEQTNVKDLEKGGYILDDCSGKPDIIIIGTGAEIHLCLSAKAGLEKENIKARVVSMPSWELFEKADPAYKEKVLPDEVGARIAVEAGLPMGWEKYVKGCNRVIGIDHFGASAPGGILLEKFGFTVDNVVKKALEILENNPK